jgi:cobalt-zinc-cadmium efflux system membrane fusion protein
MNIKKVLTVAVVTVLALGAVCGAFMFVQWVAAQELKEGRDEEKGEEGRPVLVNVPKTWFTDWESKNKAVDPGLKLTDENEKGLKIVTTAVVDAKTRPLPPQIGTLNYDNETMFLIKCRFNGELVKLLQVKDKIIDKDGYEKEITRPVKFGDKVKQGAELAIFWSVTLGTQKAAFVDAISQVRLSQDALDRLYKLWEKGATPETSLKAAERQLQGDNNNLLTAERTLRMWKMTNEEIEALRAEANEIINTKKPRNVVDEVERWARTEVPVPWFDKDHPNRELTVVEKNTNFGDIVDNTNFGTWLFRVADMSQLQIWVHPPEEYLPLIYEGMKKNGGLMWEIRIQSDPSAPAHVLRVDRVSPSLEPNQHNPMVIGYLPNVDHKYLVGQFVTATIYMPPEDNTAEVPTMAINEYNGQSFVFVKNKEKPGEYSIRRVAVVRRYADYTIVRTKLRDQDQRYSAEEIKEGRYPLRTLDRGEQVVTHGVVELTTALETLLNKESIKLLQQ